MQIEKSVNAQKAYFATGATLPFAFRLGCNPTGIWEIFELRTDLCGTGLLFGRCESKGTFSETGERAGIKNVWGFPLRES